MSGSNQGAADPATAARLRDIIAREIIYVLDRERPADRIGTVQSWDTEGRSASVLFPDMATPVTVRMGSVAPTEVGQQVRVGGRNGQWFIEDVLGIAGSVGFRPGEISQVTIKGVAGALEGLTVAWDTTERYPVYRVEWALDAGFTLGVESEETNNIASFVIRGLSPLTDYWVRIYGGNGQGDFGPASAPVGPTQTSLIAGDGAPPATSPTPVVDGGIGNVVAKWVPVVNADPVTYEVYASLVSGFTPDASNKMGETDGTFYYIDQLADGTPLPTTEAAGGETFVRIIAKDNDGAAAAGAQGFGYAQAIDLGNVANIPYSSIGDGIAPTSSPVPTVTPTPSALYLEWLHPTNDDQLVYELHLSTVSGFTPASNTLVGETVSNFAWIHNQAVVDGAGDLQDGVTYYLRIVAKDNDGVAPPSAQQAVQVRLVEAGDIGAGEIGTTLIADAAISSAKIVDAAITNAKIADLAVDGAKIANASIVEANIADAAIGVAKIQDAAITDAKISDLSASKLTAGTISSAIIELDGAASVLKSSNFVSGASGWVIFGSGQAEFNDIDVRGSIHIGGFDDTSFHVDTAGRMWMGGASYGTGTLRIDSTGDIETDGSVTLTNTGTFATAVTGGRVEMRSDTTSAVDFNGNTIAAGVGEIEFWGTDVDRKARISCFTLGAIRTLSLIAPWDAVQDGTDLPSAIELSSDGMTLRGSGTGVAEAQFILMDTNGVTVSAGPAPRANFVFASEDITSDGNMNLTSTNDRVSLWAGGVEVFRASAGGIPNANMASTTSTANLVSASGAGGALRQLRVSTSSERFKTDIEDVSGALERVKAMRPIEFTSTIEEDEGLRSRGFSAENLDGVDAKLASYEDDGETPRGINQVAILADLVAAVQELAGK